MSVDKELAQHMDDFVREILEKQTHAETAKHLVYILAVRSMERVEKKEDGVQTARAADNVLEKGFGVTDEDFKDGKGETDSQEPDGGSGDVGI